MKLLCAPPRTLEVNEQSLKKKPAEVVGSLHYLFVVEIFRWKTSYIEGK